MHATNDLDRIAANVLHQYGFEVTPDEVTRECSEAYRIIREALGSNRRLVPKSEHDMRHWLEALRQGEADSAIRRRLAAGERIADIEADLDRRENRRAK